MRYRPRPPVPCKIDQYRKIIQARLSEYPRLSATRLFDEIGAAGYAGGDTQVKEYVREVRLEGTGDFAQLGFRRLWDSLRLQESLAGSLWRVVSLGDLRAMPVLLGELAQRMEEVHEQSRGAIQRCDVTLRTTRDWRQARRAAGQQRIPRRTRPRT